MAQPGKADKEVARSYVSEIIVPSRPFARQKIKVPWPARILLGWTFNRHAASRRPPGRLASAACGPTLLEICRRKGPGPLSLGFQVRGAQGGCGETGRGSELASRVVEWRFRRLRATSLRLAARRAHELNYGRQLRCIAFIESDASRIPSFLALYRVASLMSNFE